MEHWRCCVAVASSCQSFRSCYPPILPTSQLAKPCSADLSTPACRSIHLLMALSLGTHREQLEHRRNELCPRPLRLRPPFLRLKLGMRAGGVAAEWYATSASSCACIASGRIESGPRPHSVVEAVVDIILQPVQMHKAGRACVSQERRASTGVRRIPCGSGKCMAAQSSCA